MQIWEGLLFTGVDPAQHSCLDCCSQDTSCHVLLIKISQPHSRVQLYRPRSVHQMQMLYPP